MTGKETPTVSTWTSSSRYESDRPEFFRGYFLSFVSGLGSLSRFQASRLKPGQGNLELSRELMSDNRVRVCFLLLCFCELCNKFAGASQNYGSIENYS